MKLFSRRAFTMVELVFVIVVLGILAAVAIPRLAATRDDAEVAKARSDISSIRSGISMQRSKLLMQGGDPSSLVLDSATPNTPGEELFSNVLEYPIIAGEGDGKWKKDDNDTYSFGLSNTWVSFDYDSSAGKFDCQDGTSEDCLALTQ